MAVSARSSVARCRSNSGCGTGELLEVVSASLVVVDRDSVGDGVALTGEDETAGDFVVLEREVHIHVHLAGHELRPARRAYAALARIGKLHAVAQAPVDDALRRAVERERPRSAVEDRRHFALRAIRVER